MTLTISANSESDLPRRTWYRWWSDLPAWLRIGCWAVFATVIVQIAIVVRIIIGLIEPTEFATLRRPGVHILVESDRRGEPFKGFNHLVDGFHGRSCNDVVAIRLDEQATDADLKWIGHHFQNVEDLYLGGGDISDEGSSPPSKACSKIFAPVTRWVSSKMHAVVELRSESVDLRIRLMIVDRCDAKLLASHML